MIFIVLLTGFILIGCGFLVKIYPDLIAGYNTLSKTEKEKININTLSSFLKKLLISSGIFWIGFYFILKSLNIEEENNLLINSSILVITIIAASIYANTSSRFKNKNK